MRNLLQRPDLFSINTATLGYKTPLPAIIDACAARGIGAIAPLEKGAGRRERIGDCPPAGGESYGRIGILSQHLLHRPYAGRT